jgi:exocyst complex protein 7
VPEVKAAVGSALLKLGDGNWKMGEGITVPKTARLGEGDEDLILENFICQFFLSPFHRSLTSLQSTW